MRQFSEATLTEAVIERLAECEDPRFKRVMSSLIRHLHGFVRDVELSEAEWLTAIRFLTEVGQACTDKRQEFILLSDTLGRLDPGRCDQPSDADRGGRADRARALLPGGRARAAARRRHRERGRGRARLLLRAPADAGGRADRGRPAGCLVGRRRGHLRYADPGPDRDALPRQVPDRCRGALPVPLDPADLLPGADRRPGRPHAERRWGAIPTARGTST